MAIFFGNKTFNKKPVENILQFYAKKDIFIALNCSLFAVANLF